MRQDLSSGNTDHSNKVNYDIGIVQNEKFYESSIPFSNINCMPSELSQDGMHVGHIRRPLNLHQYEGKAVVISTDNIGRSEVVEEVGPRLTEVFKNMFNGTCNKL